MLANQLISLFLLICIWLTNEATAFWVNTEGIETCNRELCMANIRPMSEKIESYHRYSLRKIYQDVATKQNSVAHDTMLKNFEPWLDHDLLNSFLLTCDYQLVSDVIKQLFQVCDQWWNSIDKNVHFDLSKVRNFGLEFYKAAVEIINQQKQQLPNQENKQESLEMEQRIRLLQQDIKPFEKFIDIAQVKIKSLIQKSQKPKITKDAQKKLHEAIQGGKINQVKAIAAKYDSSWRITTFNQDYGLIRESKSHLLTPIEYLVKLGYNHGSLYTKTSNLRTWFAMRYLLEYKTIEELVTDCDEFGIMKRAQQWADFAKNGDKTDFTPMTKQYSAFMVEMYCDPWVQPESSVISLLKCPADMLVNTIAILTQASENSLQKPYQKKIYQTWKKYSGDADPKVKAAIETLATLQ